MVRKNPIAIAAVTICFSLIFMCGCVVAQSTKPSIPPPNQSTQNGEGTTNTNGVGDGNQHPSTATTPSAEFSISDQPQSSGKKEQSEASPKRDDEGNGGYYERITIEWLNAISAIFIAIFTGLLWKLTRRQTELMDNQTKALDNQTKLMASQERLIKNSERAFVFTNISNCVRVLHEITKQVMHWDISVLFENSGNTPAKNMRVFVALEPREGEIPDNFAFNESDNFEQRTLGPRATAATGIRIPAEIIQQVSMGILRAYVWGSARYDDILEGSTIHVTTFCYEILVDGDANAGSGRLIFKHHKNHNDAN